VALVVLVGLPGSGKTTTGRALAQILGRSFVDTDDVFFEREHVRVQDFLRSHDEAQFRERELLALSQALATADVVSTGGGVVTTAAARELLGQELTVWLDCSDEVLMTRVIGGDRPLLGDDPEERLVELRAQRDAHYLEVSRFRVDSSRPMDQLITQLASIVESTQATS
jgi:shikimate kinase